MKMTYKHHICGVLVDDMEIQLEYRCYTRNVPVDTQMTWRWHIVGDMQATDMCHTDDMYVYDMIGGVNFAFCGMNITWQADWLIYYISQTILHVAKFGVNAGFKKMTEQKWKKALQD